jgi:hypothetical protein
MLRRINSTTTPSIIMHPDEVREVSVIAPAEKNQPAVRTVLVNGELMVCMSAGKATLGSPVEQARKSGLYRCGFPTTKRGGGSEGE